MIRTFGPLSIAGLAIIACTAVAPAASLFTTQQDFTGFGVGNTNTAVATALFDTDGSTTNGLGNTTAPGTTGTAGGLTITVPAGSTFSSTLSPGEQANTALINALSGATVSVDYTTALVGGNYFQLLFLLNGQTSGFTTVNPTVTTAGGINTATYTLPAVATGQQYLQVGFVANTNMTGTINVDNIRTPSNVPEPASLAALAVGGVAMLRRRRA